MNAKRMEELLKKPEVIEEIKKHLWIESQKAGRDLGYDFAANDWLGKFGNTWMRSRGCAKPSSIKPKRNKKC